MNHTTFDHLPLGEERAEDVAPQSSPVPASLAHSGHLSRAQRCSLLIRAAKLVSPHGVFICVIRDVSGTGVRLRLFHEPPTGEPIELHMPGGGVHEIRKVWHDGSEVGYQFTREIELSELVHDTSQFSKRGLRLGFFIPVNVRCLTGVHEGVIDNMSQQGAHFSCDGRFAIDQNLRIECPERAIGFGEVSAKVRWRENGEYGVVFENTLSLEQLARLAARIQCPDLVR